MNTDTSERPKQNERDTGNRHEIPHLQEVMRNMSHANPRWRYRFSNYKRAFTLLREAIETMSESGLSQLEREGTIQRFEYTMELAWNVMKDYLEHEGVVFEQTTPRNVIRRAFESNLTEHGRVWMEALDARNKISHTYNFQQFEEVIENIRSRYLAAMEDLYLVLLEKEADID